MTQTTTSNDKMNAALEYIKLGLPVHPLRGKIPLLKDWPNKASTDEAKVRAWFEERPSSNIGIVTGERSGIFVLDVDVKSGGIENLDLLESEHGPLLDTLVAQTGGGGLHHFFKYPPGGLSNATGDLPSGLDIRGEGGQVAVHPSVHESGHTYEWQDYEPGEIPIAEAPPWLLALIKGKVSSNENGTRSRLYPQDFSEIPEGERNKTLFKLGCSLRSKGSTEEEITNILNLHNEERCTPQLDQKDIKTIIGSILKYSPGSYNGQDDTDTLRVGCYEQTDDGIFYYKSKGDEENRIRLTNFPAHIISETREDDGAEVNTKFEISSKLRGRNYQLSVPSSEFTSLSWVVRELGAGTIITPGSSLKDNARAAIQYLSGDIPSKTTFTHTGWRKVDGKWLFLTAVGPIGPQGPQIGVDIGLGEGRMKDYVLPEPPQGDRLAEVIREIGRASCRERVYAPV